MQYHVVPILGPGDKVIKVLIVNATQGTYVLLAAAEEDPIPGEPATGVLPKAETARVESLVLADIGNTTRAHPAWDRVARFSDETSALSWADEQLAPLGRVAREHANEEDAEALANARALLRSLMARTSDLGQMPLARWQEEQEAIGKSLVTLSEQLWVLSTRPLKERVKPKPARKPRKQP